MKLFGVLKKKATADDLYRIDQDIRSFCRSHKGELSEREHKQLRKKLDKRASAMSDVLGIEIHSVCGK